VEDTGIYDVRHTTGQFKVAESNWPKYGVPYQPNGDHFASYYERATGLWINYIRIAPIYFRDTWMSTINSDGTLSNVFDQGSSKYPSVAPGFWHLNLNRCARAHTYDQRYNCYDAYTAHNDCNGTGLFASGGRMAAYVGSASGSEIYSHKPAGIGLNRAFATMASYVCDGYHSISAKGTLTQCVKDGSGNDGHRSIIMTYCNQWGCGYEGIQTPDALATACHCCNCIKSSSTVYTNRRIAVAAHVAVPSDYSTKYMYVVTVSGTDTTVPKLYVDGAAVTLTSKYKGTAGIVYESAYFDITTTAECSYYYVTLGSERYPEEGFLGT